MPTHKGVCLLSDAPGQAFSLQEQICHKVAYVRQHMTAQPDAPIAIIGHSIGKYVCTLSDGKSSKSCHQHMVYAGAYMALKVTKQLQALPSGSLEVAKVTTDPTHICCQSPRMHRQVTIQDLKLICRVCRFWHCSHSFKQTLVMGSRRSCVHLLKHPG